MATNAGIKSIVHVLDLLTKFGPETLPPEAADAAIRLRQIIGTRNVVAVGVGEKLKESKGTGLLALRFYVRRKLPINKLKAASRIPTAVPGELRRGTAPVLTDVIVLGPIKLDGVSIRPGDSMGHVKVSAGTFGALVTANGRIELLSNSHVLALSGKAKKGDAILAPARDDGGESPRDVIAHLSKFKRFVTGGAFVNKADCALATPVLERLDDFKSAVPRVGVPSGTITAKRGMKIVKVGRTTGRTFGVVQDTHFRFVLKYQGVGNVGFTDQVLCSRYSAPGDSGALVIDRESGCATGLHFASAPEGSVFSPIAAVLQALGGPSLVTKRPA